MRMGEVNPEMLWIDLKFFVDKYVTGMSMQLIFSLLMDLSIAIYERKLAFLSDLSAMLLIVTIILKFLFKLRLPTDIPILIRMFQKIQVKALKHDIIMLDVSPNIKISKILLVHNGSVQ